jgi:hypothetical protein
VRVLTLRELNRATLARQFLLERRKLSVLSAIERLAGMQAQWPQAPYVGLWTRIPGFRRDTLERAIRSGKVVKATVMRGTLHLVTERDYGMFFAALTDMRAWADDESLELGTRLAPEVRAMFDDGPLTAQQVLERMATEHRIDDEVTRRRTWWVSRKTGHVLHAPETALFAARPQALFAPVAVPASVETTLARAELVRRYLAAFGPASRADLADWSGLRVSDVADALDSLEPLRRFRDERGRELLDLPRGPLPDAGTPAPVRFLPKWDNVLLGFADRTRVLPEEYRKTVIAKNGDVAQTFLVDGVVAGTWRQEKEKVKLAPFAPLPRPVRREAEDEAARLAQFLR